MTRILFTCWPFPGHVLPQLGVARALRERGHEVLFATGASAAPGIERAGFDVAPFRHLDEGRARAAVEALEQRDQRSRPSPALVRRTFREWLVETIPDQLADLGPLVDAWRPDGISTDVAFWSPMVVLHEQAGVPVAVFPTFLGPLIPGPGAPPWGLGLPPPKGPVGRFLTRSVNAATKWGGRGLRARVDELRAAHGLGPLGCTVNELMGRLPLCLVGGVRELDYGRADLPPSVHYVGDCTWHPSGGDGGDSGGDGDEWLAGVPGDQPWVHVSEGTLHSGDPFLLRAAAEGLARRPVQVVLTAGQRDPAALGLGPLAPNVHLAGWVDHATLLPRCRVVITAGGAGTIISSLRAGVPLVVVPTTWDKPDNARRVTEAGVGVRLSPRRCTPARLRAAVEEVLADPGYARRARAAAALLDRAPGPGGAAELLVAMAREGAPASGRTGEGRE